MNMHTYNTNSPAHPKLTFWLVVCSISISGLIGWICSWVQSAWGFALGGLSSLTIFGGLYFAFNHWLWKVEYLQKILLVPNLNGDWVVNGKTTKRDGQEVMFDWQAEISIIQSWSKISILLKTSQSSSRSITASLYRYQGEGFRLMYHYDNNPNADEIELSRHSGECDLMFSKDLKIAQGEYFTDRDRLTVGTMELIRKDSENE